VKKTILRITLIFGLPAVMAFYAACNSTSLTGIEASLPDIQDKPDGVYRGNYDLAGTPVKVTLDVTVQDYSIAAISIVKHICSPIGKKAEKITGKVIEAQSLNVDVVSGATGSSKAILKAVENALQ
jgi:uncharacterized protein with FMN-binding domain